MMPSPRRLTTTVASVWLALAATGCTPAPAPDPPVTAGPASAPKAAIAPASSSTQPAPATTPTSSGEIAAAVPAAPVAAIAPQEPGSALLRAHAEFEKVRGGKPLKLGAEGPAVTMLQAMLLFWNYPLTPADVTGRYDQKTAIAVYQYRLDMGLSERKAGSPAAFQSEARAGGVFDKAALALFESRLAAANYRVIREIDIKRGVRFHVPAGTTADVALGAIIPDPDKLKKARAWGASATIDTTHTGAAPGEVAAWISILDYACVASTRLDDATCKH